MIYSVYTSPQQTMRASTQYNKCCPDSWYTSVQGFLLYL